MDNQDGVNPPNNQDGVNPPNNQDGVNPPNNQDGVNPPNNQNGPIPPNDQNQNNQNNQGNPFANLGLGYLPFDRKLPKFSGTGSAGSLSVEEWIDEVEGSFQLFNIPEGHRADLLYRQLEGEARRHVAVLSNAERTDLERLKDRLVEAFGDTAHVSVIMGQFYSRVQLPKETLQSYALALQELLKRADRRRGQPLVDTDSTLRDRFLDGIRDEWLRRQLRREVMRAPVENPRTFREIKEEAFHLSGEWGASTSSVQVQASQMVVESTDMTTELTKLREETQKSLDSLRQEISRLTTNSYSVNKTTRGSTAPWTARKSNSRPTDKWDPSGKPICRRCELVGHMERECRRPQQNTYSVVNPN
ncbi:uncharacterized protein LOC144914996 [Branchiostoma floridae x Branchiostoma belcheri]